MIDQAAKPRKANSTFDVGRSKSVSASFHNYTFLIVLHAFSLHQPRTRAFFARYASSWY